MRAHPAVDRHSFSGWEASTESKLGLGAAHSHNINNQLLTPMAGRTIVRKLFYTLAALNGTANDAAHIDIARNGSLVAFEIAFTHNQALADGTYSRIEVSTQAANMLSTNDAQGIIGECGVDTRFTTSGAVDTTKIAVVRGIDLPLKQGQRIYVHAITGAAVTGWVSVYLYIRED